MFTYDILEVIEVFFFVFLKVYFALMCTNLDGEFNHPLIIRRLVVFLSIFIIQFTRLYYR